MKLTQRELEIATNALQFYTDFHLKEPGEKLEAETLFSKIPNLQTAILEQSELLTDLHKHITKCARRDNNIEHYPAEWMPLKKRLTEIISKL